MTYNKSAMVFGQFSSDLSNSSINKTFFENTTSEYAELYPIRGSLELVIPLTIIYSLIFISGMLGNIITCIVIAKNRAMHTATNYYLFSLAISDLLLLISGLPLEIYGIWYRYPFPFIESVCILQGFAAETSANATVLTITAFTAERYIAICHPFLSHTMSKLSRAIKFILGIWLLAMGLAIPQILDLGITSDYDTCGIKSNSRKHVFTISSILCFVFPMIVITVLYVQIGLQLRRSKIVGRAVTANGNSIRLKTKYRLPSQKNILLSLDKSGKTTNLLAHEQSHILMEAVYHNNKRQVSERISNSSYDEGRKNYSYKWCMGTRHVVNMLVAVVVAFFLCWAPHHAQRLFAMNAHPKYSAIYDVLTYISGVLYYLSTCINPFLYNIMSYKFREAFKNTCARYFYHRRCTKFPPGLLSSSLSQASNSQSAHTYSSICSCQNMQSSNVNTIDQDISMLRYTKRPLTVKFKTTHNHRDLQIASNFKDNDYNKQFDYKMSSSHFQINCIHNMDPMTKYIFPDIEHNNRNKTSLKMDSAILNTDLCVSDNITHKIDENHTYDICYRQKSIARKNSSPYKSPVLTPESRILEDNLQIILKNVIRYEYCENRSRLQNKLLKSKSMSSLSVTKK